MCAFVCVLVCECAHVTELIASQHGVDMCVIESKCLNFSECKSMKIQDSTDETYEPYLHQNVFDKHQHFQKKKPPTLIRLDFFYPSF